MNHKKNLKLSYYSTVLVLSLLIAFCIPLKAQAARSLEEVLYEGMKNWQTEIDVSECQVLWSDFYDVVIPAFNKTFYENPDLFYVWYDETHGIGAGSSGNYVGVITVQYNPLYSASDQALFYATCDAIINGMPSGLSEEQKALYLHDYLVTHCEYDWSFSNYNAYNALIDGKAVCQGYSLAYEYLCHKAGLSAGFVNSEQNNHAWNVVVIDGVYYFVDCTGDDPANNWYEACCVHENFLRSTDGIATTTNHVKGDWTCYSFDNVAGLAQTSTKYDTYYWSDCVSPIAFVGTTEAYSLESDHDNVYIRTKDGNVKAVDMQSLNTIWSVWGSSLSNWTSNYVTMAAVGDNFYFSTPQMIYRMSVDGTFEAFHELSDEDKQVGYIYGILAEGNAIAYNVGTIAYKTDFTRRVVQIPASVIIVPEGTAMIDHASASFQGRIELNFYLRLADSLINDSGTKVVITKANATPVEMTVSQAVPVNEGDGMQYCFIYPVVAKEIRDNVNIRVYDGAGNVATFTNVKGSNDYTTTGVNYSVYTYATRMLEKGDDAMKVLAQALIDYGTAAQIYFRYGDYKALAVSDSVTNVTLADLSGYAAKFYDGNGDPAENEGAYPDGMTNRSIAVVFESDNTFKLYYEFAKGVNPLPTEGNGPYTFTIDGNPATLRSVSGNYWLELANTPANHLGKLHRLTITDGTKTYTVECSALAYARSSAKSEDIPRQNLGKALHLYYLAAKAKFGE